MKVAFIVGEFPLLSEAFILNQITGLIDRGHDVHIYALHGQSTDISKVHPSVYEYRLLERTHYSPNLPKHFPMRAIKGLQLLASKKMLFSQGWLKLLNPLKYGRQALSLRLLYRAMPFLEKECYDIVHGQFGTFGTLALLFQDADLLTGKLVTTFRGIDISQVIRQHGEQFYQDLFQHGDFFLANCDFFRQRVLKLGCPAEKIVVHGSGIDCKKFAFMPRYPSPDGFIRIVTTGRLVEKKGIEYCIRAVAQVAQIYPNIEYNILGDGPLRPSLEQLIQDLDIGQQVKLLGWQQQKEIIQILDQSHLCLATSVTSESGDQDAPVNTLKEAMAMGLPVISTIHGGIPELVEDGVSGFLVPERDVEAIAQKLIFLIQHPEQWVQMGQAGRAKVEELYDMQKLNDELVEIYENLLKSITEIERSPSPVTR